MYLRVILKLYNIFFFYFLFFINKSFFIFYYFNGLIVDYFFLENISFSRFKNYILILTIFIYNFKYVNIENKKKNKKILILFENHNLLIINKKSNTTMQELILYVINYCFFLDLRFINFINRLDKETSGIVLFSKNFFSFRKYCDIFKKRIIKKKYFGFCYSRKKADSLSIKNFHTRNSSSLVFFSSKNFYLNSRYCFSNFKFFNFFMNFSEVYISLITGRSHQIRVQLRSFNSFLLNDKKYGFLISDFNFNRETKLNLFLYNDLFLHSHLIFFCDPFLKIFLRIISPLSCKFLKFKRTWDIRIRT